MIASFCSTPNRRRRFTRRSNSAVGTPDQGFRKGDVGTLLDSTLLILLSTMWGHCVHTGIRILMVGATAVWMFGSGGAPISHAGDLGQTAPILSLKPAYSGSSQHPQLVAKLSKDEIREAQLELRRSGLYNGSVDGVIGRQTRQALLRFQRDNGLDQTATLDGLTLVAMFGNIGTSQGSRVSPNAGGGTGQ